MLMMILLNNDIMFEICQYLEIEYILNLYRAMRKGVPVDIIDHAIYGDINCGTCGVASNRYCSSCCNPNVRIINRCFLCDIPLCIPCVRECDRYDGREDEYCSRCHNNLPECSECFKKYNPNLHHPFEIMKCTECNLTSCSGCTAHCYYCEAAKCIFCMSECCINK